MRIKLALWSIVLLGTLGQSCIPNKKVVYLQTNEINPLPVDSLVKTSYNQYQLKKGDLINVEVRSSDPMLAQIFIPTINGANLGQVATAGNNLNYIQGYALNANGDIELPLVGFIHIEGLTIEESKKLISAEIAKFIKSPYIAVKLGGIPYATLGEFNRPGRYSALQSRLTILEAIANSGDLTILANRKKFTLIRQHKEGIKRHLIDLTDEELLISPYYYIQPGDQLYAEPLKVRQWGVGVTGSQTFTTILSIVSSTLLIIITANQL